MKTTPPPKRATGHNLSMSRRDVIRLGIKKVRSIMSSRKQDDRWFRQAVLCNMFKRLRMEESNKVAIVEMDNKPKGSRRGPRMKDFLLFRWTIDTHQTQEVRPKAPPRIPNFKMRWAKPKRGRFMGAFFKCTRKQSRAYDIEKLKCCVVDLKENRPKRIAKKELELHEMMEYARKVQFM